MWLFYLMAIIPAIIGGVFWLQKKQVIWWEWLAGVGVAFATSALVHLLAFQSATHDIETWSGQVTQTTHHPYWHESWTEIETTTDAEGNISTRVVHRSDSHPEHWTCRDNIGGYRSISQGFFNTLKTNFGGEVVRNKPHRPNLDGGSPYTFTTSNGTNYVEPVNITKSFENRIKAAPSLHAFSKVPEGTLGLYEYPVSPGWNQSDRLLGASSSVGIRAWDQMNSRLGPSKKVNVIMIGFGDMDSSTAHMQQAKWVGGKKNDLVLCYGGDINATWAFVFGWTEQEIVKRNLESILLEHPVDTNIIPMLEEEISANYEIKDWSKFDYIAIEPPTWCYFLLMFVMAATQTGFWFWAHRNDQDKKWEME
jgi:hypothetical protein